MTKLTAFYFKCRITCPIGKGCKQRNQPGMTWEKLEKICPKNIRA